jgi:prophage regulatory protein
MSLKPKRFLRLPQVTEKTGLPQSSIYEKKARGEFPQPIKLGPQTVAWDEDELDAWMAKKLGQRDRAAAGE